MELSGFYSKSTYGGEGVVEGGVNSLGEQDPLTLIRLDVLEVFFPVISLYFKKK